MKNIKTIPSFTLPIVPSGTSGLASVSGGCFVMESGIYKIHWPDSGYFYYGQAQHLKKRKSIHFARLKKGTHENEMMQRVFLKYGLPIFEFVEFCEISLLDSVEQKYLDEHFNHKLCCNFCPTANSTRGYKLSAQMRKRISDRRKGTLLSESHKKAIGAGLVLAYSSGKKQAPDMRGSKNSFYGKKHTELFKKNHAKARTGLNLNGDNPNAKMVLNIETGIFYDCIKEAAMASNKTYKIIYSDIKKNKSQLILI